MSGNVGNGRPVVRKHVVWLALQIIVLIFFQWLIETLYTTRVLSVLGPDDIQQLVYDVLQKCLLSGYVWFFFSVFKRFIIPFVTRTISFATDKFVRRSEAKQQATEAVARYLRYIGYLLVIIALISIWAYSFIGTWMGGALGTAGVLSLTFILGLFTSSVLGNLLAYWVLNNTMEFKAGDRVQIGETYGDVVELSLFFTRIKTIKDEIISMPNLSVMGKDVQNFSALGTVLVHVPVTLGYDVDKEQAKRLLLQSANETPGLLTTGDVKPFVLLLDLGKYTVTYEINAYTDQPNNLIQIKSDLIDNILHAFKIAQVELLSPSYIALRETP